MTTQTEAEGLVGVAQAHTKPWPGRKRQFKKAPHSPTKKEAGRIWLVCLSCLACVSVLFDCCVEAMSRGGLLKHLVCSCDKWRQLSKTLGFVCVFDFFASLSNIPSIKNVCKASSHKLQLIVHSKSTAGKSSDYVFICMYMHLSGCVWACVREWKGILAIENNLRK